jgi:hypothetical protein
MKFLLLIIFIINGGSVQVASKEFKTPEECNAAAATINEEVTKAALPKDVAGVVLFCTDKLRAVHGTEYEARVA